MFKLSSPAGACLAALSMLLAGPVQAATSEPETQPVEDVQIVETATPALWKIADEDTTIYLFGTIHVLPKGIDWFEGRIADAFNASGSLVTEVAGKDDAAMQGLVVKLAVLPEGASLRDKLSPEQRTAYEAALAAYSIPPAMLDRFEPWYAAVALSTLPLLKEGYSPENGVEEALDQKAQARKLEHTGLETVDYQLGLFDSLPEDVQKRYLAEVVGQLPSFKEEIRSMIEAWKSGDAEKLAKIMNADESDPVMVEALLTGRNRAWAEWLAERMGAPGTVFVAVGAGHLAGAGSVQEQLAARGIAITRLQ